MTVNASCDVRKVLLDEDGAFPNNPHLPLLLYIGALTFEEEDAGDRVEALFQENGWGGTWQNGVFSYHHYHSTAHEVLACCSGSATVQFGGPHGPEISVEAGDVAILPAGTAHKKLNGSDDFLIVGGYPGAAQVDMCYGKDEERPEADKRIADVGVPDTDPVFGAEGGLAGYWGSGES